MEFTNPESLKIDLESIFKGGNSKSRNPRIQKMFSLIGLGEGAGSGFPKILAAWNEQSWRTPELKEETNLNQVSLKLWMISMLPEECLESLKSIFGKAFNSFNKDEVLILATAYLEGSVNNARIQLMMDKHSYGITGILHDLVEKETLIEDGYGRGKVYYLNDEYNSNVDFNNILIKDKPLNNDQINILEYIKVNGSISNKECREKFEFGKTKAFGLLKNLEELEKIKKLVKDLKWSLCQGHFEKG
ncbi:ATP-binding protein [Clostridium beijerinckii]|uniref:ATP-binding protein n=2 Tax=Clostridium beijerinckii TaxID=1520 RepID=UPI001570AFF7|nr:ATP-binding protein [Clostridium beijerinckii]NRW84240.1 putative HTH transcriptional regulator [Clostridium beijerinckii]